MSSDRSGTAHHQPAEPPTRPARGERREFATADGVHFTVREELAPEVGVVGDDGAPSVGFLVFESDVITYRVYSYPADWAFLAPELLLGLAIESRPTRAAAAALAPPAVGAGGVLEFTDYTGVEWRVVEDACGRISDPTARTRRCLVFTTALFVRRVYDFPIDWARLSSEALIALSSTH
jgi:hypothetical protein